MIRAIQRKKYRLPKALPHESSGKWKSKVIRHYLTPIILLEILKSLISNDKDGDTQKFSCMADRV